MLFGIGLYFWQGARYAGALFRLGCITEYSLSVDNLFVFVVLMALVAVPVELQHRVLLIGVVIALDPQDDSDHFLVRRSSLSSSGSSSFSDLPHLDGLEGVGLRRRRDEPWGNKLVKFVERRVSFPRVAGLKLVTRIDGKRADHADAAARSLLSDQPTCCSPSTPIPAVFGLTQEAYIVFTVNAFALMWVCRQLYFLLNGLLDKLIYLNKGLR